MHACSHVASYACMVLACACCELAIASLNQIILGANFLSTVIFIYIYISSRNMICLPKNPILIFKRICFKVYVFN